MLAQELVSRSGEREVSSTELTSGVVLIVRSGDHVLVERYRANQRKGVIKGAMGFPSETLEPDDRSHADAISRILREELHIEDPMPELLPGDSTSLLLVPFHMFDGSQGLAYVHTVSIPDTDEARARLIHKGKNNEVYGAAFIPLQWLVDDLGDRDVHYAYRRIPSTLFIATLALGSNHISDDFAPVADFEINT